MRVGLTVLALAVLPTFQLVAQDTARVNEPAALLVKPDTTHRMRPMNAFWRSLLIPGWGQAATDRHTMGAVFVAWEGVTAMMTLKAQQEANYLKSIGSGTLRGKRQEVQDWLVLWVFNHLFSGAEAYVSAHLRDFPPELQIRAVPGGIGVTLPLPPVHRR